MGSPFTSSLTLVSGLVISLFAPCVGEQFISAIGDAGMKSQNIRVSLEAWNFCNEVGEEAPGMGSPRMADCADLYCPLIADSLGKHIHGHDDECEVHQKVAKSDNLLGAGDKFRDSHFKPYIDPDLYAVQKELYLGSLCEVDSSNDPWQFWTVMLKNGNFNTKTSLCPENGKKVSPIVTDRKFPCFGEGCMNQPLVYHNWSRVFSIKNQSSSLVGSFYGTYDLDADLSKSVDSNSYFSVSWSKNQKTGSWVFSHKLITSAKYPWLMLYLRSDATKGFNGGYHYEGCGIMKKLPESPNFKVQLSLDIKKGGGPNSQFYLMDIGSCWKNNGEQCNGDVETDVTRYSEMIINPETTSWCRPNNLVSCPPFHISPSGEKIYRNETSRFPYSAYHLYCGPGNGAYLEKPVDICDPYSNPQAQELVQILPHAEWAVHGYPAKKGDGWIGDSRTWELDVGALSSRLYFYQDPGTKPAKRVWTSLNVGTEIYVSQTGQTAEWTGHFSAPILPSSMKTDPSSPSIPQLLASPIATRNIVVDILDDQHVTSSIGDTRHFLVRWKDRPFTDDTWVTAAELCQLVPSLLDTYLQTHSPDLSFFQPEGNDAEHHWKTYYKRRYKRGMMGGSTRDVFELG